MNDEHRGNSRARRFGSPCAFAQVGSYLAARLSAFESCIDERSNRIGPASYANAFAHRRLVLDNKRWDHAVSSEYGSNFNPNFIHESPAQPEARHF